MNWETIVTDQNGHATSFACTTREEARSYARVARQWPETSRATARKIGA